MSSVVKNQVPCGSAKQKPKEKERNERSWADVYRRPEEACGLGRTYFTAEKMNVHDVDGIIRAK